MASEHVVQFFDSDESRATCVAAFLAEGYRAGEPLLVVARPANWSAILEELSTRDVPVQRAIAEQRLIVKGADDTLRRLSRNGSPDAALFDSIVGEPTRRILQNGGRLRAYGEMVDMLAQRGEFTEAITLEGLWNGLSERASICLMCGYSAAHFVATSTHRALREICRAHTDVHRHEQDPLATWLLTAAHNRPEQSGTASALHH